MTDLQKWNLKLAREIQEYQFASMWDAIEGKDNDNLSKMSCGMTHCAWNENGKCNNVMPREECMKNNFRYYEEDLATKEANEKKRKS